MIEDIGYEAYFAKSTDKHNENKNIHDGADCRERGTK